MSRMPFAALAECKRTCTCAHLCLSHPSRLRLSVVRVRVQVTRRMMNQGVASGWAAWHDMWAAKTWALSRLREVRARTHTRPSRDAVSNAPSGPCVGWLSLSVRRAHAFGPLHLLLLADRVSHTCVCALLISIHGGRWRRWAVVCGRPKNRRPSRAGWRCGRTRRIAHSCAHSLKRRRARKGLQSALRRS